MLVCNVILADGFAFLLWRKSHAKRGQKSPQSATDLWDWDILIASICYGMESFLKRNTRPQREITLRSVVYNLISSDTPHAIFPPLVHSLGQELQCKVPPARQVFMKLYSRFNGLGCCECSRSDRHVASGPISFPQEAFFHSKHVLKRRTSACNICMRAEVEQKQSRFQSVKVHFLE